MKAITTAIIGVGQVGSGLARNLVRGGERVWPHETMLTRPGWQRTLGLSVWIHFLGKTAGVVVAKDIRQFEDEALPAGPIGESVNER